MPDCLLCPAVAVQDALCVPCGAKLWAAKEWIRDPVATRCLFVRMERGERFDEYDHERMGALYNHVDTREKATDFLVSLGVAKASRLAQTKSCAECGRMVPRDEHRANCPLENR